MKRSSDKAKSFDHSAEIASILESKANALFKDALQLLSPDIRERVSVTWIELKKAHEQRMTPRELANAIEMRSIGRIAPKNVVERFRRLLKQATKKALKTKR